MNETRKLRNDIISVIKGENEQNMILSKPVQRLQSWLLQHNGFKANSKENSIYKVYNTFNVPIQIRVSNHGTYLWTWVDREFDPSHSINISIVISDDGNVYNKDGEETDPNNDPHINIDKQHRKRNFKVHQFVYNSTILKQKDIYSIYNSILNLIKYKRYIDPLQNNERKALYRELESNYTITENKQYKTNTMNNTKKRIRLTESDLRKLIKESIKDILNEAEFDLSPQFNKVYDFVEQARYALGELQMKLRDYSIGGDDKTTLLAGKILRHINAAAKLLGKRNFIAKRPALNPDGNFEPEDWYERNEHGDFDNY